MKVIEHNECPEFNCERLYEIVTKRIEDGGDIRWSVAAPNKKAARSAFRYLLANNKDLKILDICHEGALVISRETVNKIRNVSYEPVGAGLSRAPGA